MKALRRQKRRDAIARNAAVAASTSSTSHHEVNVDDGTGDDTANDGSLAPLPGGNSFIYSEHGGHNVVDTHDGDDHRGVDAQDGNDHRGVDAHDGDDRREGDVHDDPSDADGDEDVSSTSNGNNRLTTPHNPARYRTGQGSRPVELVERIDAVERKLKPLLETPRKRLARTNARVHELHMLVVDLNKKVNDVVKQWKSNLSLDVEDIKAALEQERHDRERCTEYANRDRQVQWRSINSLRDQLEKQIGDIRGALDADDRQRGRLAEHTENALRLLQTALEQERSQRGRDAESLHESLETLEGQQMPKANSPRIDLDAEAAERCPVDQRLEKQIGDLRRTPEAVAATTVGG